MRARKGVIDGGYILLARKILDSELMAKPPLHLKLWVWMLTRARWTDGEKLKRGQFHTSIAEMREAMSYMVGYRKVRPSVKEIRSAYEGFTKGTMIDTTKGTRGMVVTILNYDKYQSQKNYEGHNEGHNEKDTKGRVGAQDSKERKESKKKKKYKIDFNFDSGEWENIESEDLTLWQKAYPAVNLNLQLSQAAAWLVANPSKKKSDYKRFLNGWFKRCQDRGGDVPANKPQPQIQPKTYAQAQDAERRQLARWLKEQDDADQAKDAQGTGAAGHCLPAGQARQG